MNKKIGWKKWEKVGDPQIINRVPWGEEEKKALNEVLQDDWFGYGEPNKNLEKEISKRYLN